MIWIFKILCLIIQFDLNIQKYCVWLFKIFHSNIYFDFNIQKYCIWLFNLIRSFKYYIWVFKNVTIEHLIWFDCSKYYIWAFNVVWTFKSIEFVHLIWFWSFKTLYLNIEIDLIVCHDYLIWFEYSKYYIYIIQFNLNIQKYCVWLFKIIYLNIFKSNWMINHNILSIQIKPNIQK